MISSMRLWFAFTAPQCGHDTCAPMPGGENTWRAARSLSSGV
jgi:hypothetical protein